MDADAYPDAAVQELLRQFHPVKVHRDKRRDLVEKAARLTNMPPVSLPYPTRLYVDADGNEVDHETSYRDARRLAAELKDVLAAKGRLRALTEKIAAAPKDREPLLQRFRWTNERRLYALVREDGDALMKRLDPARPDDAAAWEEIAIPFARALVLGAAPDRPASSKILARYLELFPAGKNRADALYSLGFNAKFSEPPDLETAAKHFRELLEKYPDAMGAINARAFFREQPELVKKLGLDDQALGIRLVPADAVYAWVDAEKAFEQAAMEKKAVLIYEFWPL